jgi:hypothetical protein
VTTAYTLVSTITSSWPLLGSGFQCRTFSFFWVPELSPTSATKNSSQRLNPHRLSNSLTNQLTATKSKSKLKSELLYDWLFTANQFVLATSPLRLTIRDFISTEPLPSQSLCNIFSNKKVGLPFMNMLGLLSHIRIAFTDCIENTVPLLQCNCCVCVC